MQLKKVKLAGFKSFVDPTTLEFKSQLVGVVGPNGCGKSNIIDAVRWVMGESSAKNLRGGSMTDVIFNGSTSRKPVGLAAIDLIFDNSEGKLGGEYAAYAEISIRREVTRDAQSSYYLNGTKCRRKDITDIFLGTGLGPRSYSIIEQGMISRVIEAKPEDLRAFLEEAAGISIYKKRRHDTELRINHTRENLARIEDLIQEQERSLERLKRQSAAALRYKEYQTERDELDLQFKAMRWRDFDKHLQEHASRIRNVSVELEKKLSRRASIDNELSKIKVDHNDKTDVVNEIQAQYYELNTAISKKEQAIQYQQERKKQLQEDLANSQREANEINEQINEDQAKLIELEEEIITLEPAYENAKEICIEAEFNLKAVKMELAELNTEWELLQNDSQNSLKTAEVERTKIEHFERQVRDFKVNIDRLEQEQKSLHDSEFEELIAELNIDIATNENISQETLAKLNALHDNVESLRNKQQETSSELDQLREDIQVTKGRQASLEALQQAAIGTDNKDVNTWLDSHGLSQNQRLAKILKVEPGFEKAVEVVLGDYLEAICIEDIATLLNDTKGNFSKITQGKLNFIGSVLGRDPAAQATWLKGSNKVYLSSKINTTLSLDSLIANIYVVENLNEALSLRENLVAQESIITKDGIWIGINWVRVCNNNESSPKGGILAREKELTNIKVNLEKKSHQVSLLEEVFQDLAKEIVTLDLEGQDLQKNQQLTIATLRDLSSKLSAQKTKLDHVRERNKRIDDEISEYNIKLEENTDVVSGARSALESALEKMAEFSVTKEALQQQKETVADKLLSVELDVKQHQTASHELNVKWQTSITKIKAIKDGITRLHNNLLGINAKQENIDTQLRDVQFDAELKEELETLLADKSDVEIELNKARENLEILDESVNTLEKERNEIEVHAQKMRDSLDSIKMEWQSLEVRKDTIEEEFAKIAIKIEDIINTIPSEATEEAWEIRINELAKLIERLGPINLAAVEEYKSESERAEYLTLQHADLTEALATLDNAIKKIDKETKSKFQDTFDAVNANFKILFPKLFGGGEAYLALTGDDLLETGVSVMARPPGKKNSSIQLLSGGEKALTAVSLVFSIFQLNPAPFCMLDEVDAPLDDSNVDRFCKMIIEMAEKVQFIFITHNKITMAIARQLAGVTMKEPGVSRLVAVDIDEAIKLATV